MAEEKDRKLTTNVIKRRALKDEVSFVAYTVSRAMAAKALGALGDTGRSQPVADPGSPAETAAAV